MQIFVVIFWIFFFSTLFHGYEVSKRYIGWTIEARKVYNVAIVRGHDIVTQNNNLFHRHLWIKIYIV